MDKYKSSGKKVVSDSGVVVREEKNKTKAKERAKKLNRLWNAKMSGEFIPPRWG